MYFVNTSLFLSVEAKIKYSFTFFLHPRGTPRHIHVNRTWILHRYVKDQISTTLHVISKNFFDVILLIEKSTSFPRTFLDVISMVEKYTLFPRTFFDVISMVEKSTLFPGSLFDVISIHPANTYFFDVISVVEISTAFLLTFFNLILMVEKSALFAGTFSDKISMYSTSFLVSCKLMKTFEGVFLC